MSETVPNESEWAVDLAARLKAVWVDFAEAPPSQRAQYLKEELNRAIKPIPTGYRNSYLDRLRMKFPAFAPVAAPEPVAPTDDTTPVETSPQDVLVQALLQRIGGMTPEEKAALAKQLEPALPFPKPPPPAPTPASATNSKDREALEAALSNFIVLERLAWQIWANVAPQSSVRREGDLSLQAAAYARGTTDILPQMKETMIRDRMVIGGLLSAISVALQRYASDFHGTYSPDNIMAECNNNERKCWTEYARLAKQDFPIASAISFKIKGYLAQYAEDVVRRS